MASYERAMMIGGREGSDQFGRVFGDEGTGEGGDGEGEDNGANRARPEDGGEVSEWSRPAGMGPEG